MKKIDYNGNDQAVVEEDWDPCNGQGGTQNCPLKGKCQLEGENVVYVCIVPRQDTDWHTRKILWINPVVQN